MTSEAKREVALETLAEKLYRWQSYVSKQHAWEDLCEEHPAVAEDYRRRARTCAEILGL